MIQMIILILIMNFTRSVTYNEYFAGLVRSAYGEIMQILISLCR